MHNRHLDSLAALGRRLWISCLLWIIERTLCRAARIDEAVRQELAPAGRAHHPAGGERHGPRPDHSQGGRRWQSGRAGGLHPLRVRFKHPAIAFRALSFRLGVNQAFSENRLLVEGTSPSPCTWCGRWNSCRR